MPQDFFRIDLRIHSSSQRPSQWILQRMGCPESFTEPRRIYDIARARGMGMVTITDHNTVSGSLRSRTCPAAFVSEEITTYFPEDRCKLHVLVYDITEAQHAEFQRLRENVFDLVPYLRAQGIVHVLAHPLFAVNDRLARRTSRSPAHVQHLRAQRLARRSPRTASLRQVVEGLRPGDLERLADRHGIAPYGPGALGQKPGGRQRRPFVPVHRPQAHRVRRPGHPGQPAGRHPPGRGRVLGAAASPWAMAHNLYGIAYQFSEKPRRQAARHACMRLT